MSEGAISSQGPIGPGLSGLLSDERLARRAVAGDERAFAAIFRRYHQSLYRFCLAIVGNPEDAQDALQNTMAKVLRALPGEERKIELKPWLYRIAHNESIDLLRRRRETRQLEDVELAAPGAGLAEDVATRERLRRLIADMGDLPQRQREVLVMRELGGLDFEEIGTALGTSGAVVRQTLYEARQSLRQMEAGREMGCDAVTHAISDGDGRVLRRRDVRAHLRGCADCRRFRDAIEGRERDFAGLAPLPVGVAAGLLHGLMGGHTGGGGAGIGTALGGGAVKSFGAATALKGAATVAVVAAIGVGAADRSGVIHLGGSGDGGSTPATVSGGAAGGGAESGAAADSAAGAEESARFSVGEGTAGAAAKNGGAAKAKQAKGAATTGDAGSPAASGSEQDAPTASLPSENPQGRPRGRGHEKQHTGASAHGQETAAAHKGGGSHHGRSHAKQHHPHPSHPTHPAHPVKPHPAPAPPAEPRQPAPGSHSGSQPRSESGTEPEPTLEGAPEAESAGSQEIGSGKP